MVEIRVKHVTKAELHQHRDEVLADVGMTEDELEEGYRHGTLVGDQWWARDELRAISFLLGE